MDTDRPGGGCVWLILFAVVGGVVGLLIGAVLGAVHLMVHKQQGGEAAGTEVLLIPLWAIPAAALGIVAGVVWGWRYGRRRRTERPRT